MKSFNSDAAAAAVAATGSTYKGLSRYDSNSNFLSPFAVGSAAGVHRSVSIISININISINISFSIRNISISISDI